MQTRTRTIDGHEYRFEIDTVRRVSPDDGPLDLHDVESNTKVVFKDGEYELADHASVDDVEREDVIFRAAQGASPTLGAHDWDSSRKWLLNITDGRRVAVEGLNPDNTDSFRSGDVGLRLMVRDGLLVDDVEHVGASGLEPVCQWSIYPHILDEDGHGEVRNWRKNGPSIFVGHGDSDGAGGIFAQHRGKLTFRDCVVANQGGDGGWYHGKHPGSLVYDGCRFANNDMASIRAAAGCELRDCEIIVDWENAHPDNILDEAHPPSGTNAVYFSSAEFGKSGGGVFDSEVIVRSTYRRGMAAIIINNSDGAVDIQNTRIVVDVDDMPAIWCRDPATQRFDSHATPAEPWGATLRNVTIEGDGSGLNEHAPRPRGSMVCLHNRHESRLDGLRIEAPNAEIGVDIETCRDVRGRDLDIDVGGGEAVRGFYTDIPLEDPSGGEDSDSGDDSETPTMTEHELIVRGAGSGTGKHSYTLTIDGQFTRTEVDSEGGQIVDTDVGTAVEGMAVWEGGTDRYRFEGELVSFAFDSPDDASTVTLDGEPIDVPYERAGAGEGEDSEDDGGSEPATDVEQLAIDLAELRADLETLRKRVDALDNSLDDHDVRLAALEERPPLRERIKAVLFGTE